MIVKCPKCDREENITEAMFQGNDTLVKICLVCDFRYKVEKPKNEMRQFNTGATRDTDAGKNDYEGFYSPLVVEAFGDYMNKHRVQADGKLRDSDNWQKGIPKDAYMKSLWRHFLDMWFMHRGYKRYDKVTKEELTMKEVLCAIIFNVQGYLFEILKVKKEEVKQEDRPWIEKGVCLIRNYSEVSCDIGYACDACPYNKEK